MRHSPPLPACGRGRIASDPGEGASQIYSTELDAPSPNPLPASGERERALNGTSREHMPTTLLVVQILNGLQLGVILFLIAAGLTLVFGVMNFVNLAHGVQYMLGAYLAVMFYG